MSGLSGRPRLNFRTGSNDVIERKNKQWKDRHAAEKAGLMVGWTAMAALMVNWLLPSKPAPRTVPPVVIIAPTNAPPVFSEASAKALASATLYLSALDRAMVDSPAILKAGRLSELSKQSTTFTTLVDDGQAQFGRTVYESLGRCGLAAVFARSWWHSQIRAARQGGIEPTFGAIQADLDEYSRSRDECLKAADPAI